MPNLHAITLAFTLVYTVYLWHKTKNMKKIADKMFQVLYFFLFRMMRCYWFITRPQFRSAYVGVWHQEQLLIIKNSYKSYYTVPCGGAHRKERAAAAAARELSEEVGIDVSPDQLTQATRFTIYHEFMHDNVSFYEIRFDRRPAYRIDNREVAWAGFMPITDVARLRLSPVVSAYLAKKGRRDP